MNKDTHDKEWTEVEKLTVRMLIVNAMAFSPQVDKEENADKILKEYENQIRRDAYREGALKQFNDNTEVIKQVIQETKKELLDEINSKICEIILATETKDELLGKLGDYIRERAKTLGEQVKKDA